MNKCTGIIGKWYGHRYIPVYEKSPSVLNINGLETTIQGAIDLAERYRRVTILHHICVRCGSIIKGK